MFKVIVDKNIEDIPEEIIYFGKDRKRALETYNHFCNEDENWDVEYWEYDNLKFWRD